MRFVHAVRGRTFASLGRHRNYRLFFTGQIVSVSGSWMQNIAMYWLVVSLTHSALAVGLLSVARFGPFTLIALFAGTIVDRFDIRRIVITTQIVQLVLAVALAVLALTGAVEIWQIDIIAFLGGCAMVFDAPGRQALTYQMVGRDELPNAIALNSTLVNVGRVVGPAIAGVMLTAVGPGWCFAVNALSFFAVLTSLLLMRTAEFLPLDRAVRPRLLSGTREGLAFVRRSPRILAVLTMTVVFGSLLFNVNVLLPILAKDTLGGGPSVFGILMAAFGLGALVGALLSATFARASWRLAAAAATAFALCELVIAPLHDVRLVAAMLFLGGICFTVYSSNSNATVQLEAPDHLRGRVLSVYFYAWIGMTPIGSLAVSWLCDVGGTELAFAVLAVAGLAAVALSSWQLLQGRPVTRLGDPTPAAEAG